MKNILKKILSFINGLIPKNKNKIVLESSPDFSDNAKAIYDYLLKKGKRDYTFVWSVYNYERYGAEYFLSQKDFYTISDKFEQQLYKILEDRL